LTTIPDHSAGSFGAAEQLIQLGDGVQAGGLVLEQGRGGVP
jgi:hypothetical protein